MTGASFDDSGWLVGAVELLPLEQNWMLLSPEASSAMSGARWDHQAQRFFRAHIRVQPDKDYTTGGWPRSDQADVQLAAAATPVRLTTVRLCTVPWSSVPAAQVRAEQAVANIGGAGFDALLRRTQRLWQIQAEPLSGPDAQAPLLLAGVLASLFLAPVIPPHETTVFGVKGVRERIAALALGT